MNATLPDLPSVLDRFQEASDLLESMHESLQVLTRIEQHQQDHSATLQQTIENLRTMATALSTAADTTHQAMAEARHALQAAQQFLASTDLTQLRRELVATRELIEESLTRHTKTLENERDIAKSELEALRRDLAALPKKARQQLALPT